jgi:endonuclease YncB( thermonuclease family)
MPYKVIKGAFHVKGYSPDGDSIRFATDTDDHWDFFNWKSEKKRKANKKQLRIEAIDALETHYEGYRQPGAFALAALENLLSLLGIQNIKYNLALTKIVEAEDETPGYIASSKLDMYDRPVSFVFPNLPNLLIDGSELSLADLPIKKSVNYILAQKGLVYPTFYDGIESEAVEVFQKTIRNARSRKRGLWAIDKTTGFTFWESITIKRDIVILPKLFRRLISFLLKHSDINQLSDYLLTAKDYCRIIGDDQRIKFGELLSVSDLEIRMSEKPENIIFLPKG